jgi:hypothetical protein
MLRAWYLLARVLDAVADLLAAIGRAATGGRP